MLLIFLRQNPSPSPPSFKTLPKARTQHALIIFASWPACQLAQLAWLAGCWPADQPGQLAVCDVRQAAAGTYYLLLIMVFIIYFIHIRPHTSVHTPVHIFPRYPSLSLIHHSALLLFADFVNIIPTYNIKSRI